MAEVAVRDLRNHGGKSWRVDDGLSTDWEVSDNLFFGARVVGPLEPYVVGYCECLVGLGFTEAARAHTVVMWGAAPTAPPAALTPTDALVDRFRAHLLSERGLRRSGAASDVASVLPLSLGSRPTSGDHRVQCVVGRSVGRSVGRRSFKIKRSRGYDTNSRWILTSDGDLVLPLTGRGDHQRDPNPAERCRCRRSFPRPCCRSAPAPRCRRVGSAATTGCRWRRP